MVDPIKPNILALIILLSYSYRIYGFQKVPCYFIFGDSTADNGNNNMLATRAKANYPPYGIDFPFGPTGRFTNGRTMYDVIAEFLGFAKDIPPFAMARGVLKGVNYASGSAGIRNESGTQFGSNVNMNKQLENHGMTVRRIAEILGGSKAAADELLCKCIYTVGIGENDFANNYFMPQYFPSSHQYTLKQFVQILIDEYYEQLRTLYAYGARKVAVVAVRAIGCTPNAISNYGTTNGSVCVDSLNNAVNLFNQKLTPLVNRLNRDLPKAEFTFVNPELPRAEIVRLGVRIFDKGCCPVSDIGLCIEFSTPCPNRLDHEYWDAIHLAEIVNKAMGNVAYRAIAASYL